MDVPDDFVRFCDSQWPQLVSSLSLYCGDRLVAEDLAQEALVRACERWSKVSGMASPGAWLHRVAVNLANSHFRRRKAERYAVRRKIRQDVPAEQREAADAIAVRRAVSRLPARQREAVALRFCLQWTVAETAAAMGTT